jgi:hypothetical protein
MQFALASARPAAFARAATRPAQVRPGRLAQRSAAARGASDAPI